MSQERSGGRPSRGLAAGLGGALALLVLLGALVAGWALWSYGGPGPAASNPAPPADPGQAAPSTPETTVVLRRGAGLNEIAGALDEAGVIRSGTVFNVAARLTGSSADLKAGEYSFPSRSSMAEVLGKIRRGEIVRHMVTIPEGVTSAQAAAILARHPVLTGTAPVAPEGALLPETYDVQRGDDRAAVLQRMTAARDKALAELWAARQPGLPVDTPEEAVILASIVEKETGIASERPRVAAVFVNRMRQGMRLESDPTIIYGLTRGEPLVDATGRRRGLRQSELQRPNPYSTYQIPGLPPTPICNPGIDALRAVLNPPETQDLFFVADGTGGHVFARTFQEHLRNVARWREVERARAAGAG